MILLIGLGNPGKKYQNTRHNVGHMFVDFFTNQSSSNEGYRLFKTNCFMNESGKFVKKITGHYSLDTNPLLIVHDDLDIPFGKFHIQKGVGPKLHNGLKSIEENLKRNDFWRLRIGVDNRRPENRVGGQSYVLHRFQDDEISRLQEEIFPKITSQLNLFLKSEFLPHI
ncbi:aminoacyl-tRNA hydrolase [Patescibacteria group bacterium]|nr:aminoacyl-tRNA hydrolase [Patescibacteria group bacterium]